MAFGLIASASPAALGEAIPLAVDGGRCCFTVRADRTDERYYLVIGSLAAARETTRITIRAEATDGPALLSRAAATFRSMRDDQPEKARRAAGFIPAAVGPAPSPPAQERIFHVFAKGKDLDSPAGYVAITGDLYRVGRHCQVYVDRTESRTADLDRTVDDIIRTFDEEVRPWADRHLGHVRDVDRDGRFTILLTAWLGKLEDGATAVDGFVRGSDFLLDAAAPFSNHADMMYLNPRLKPGPHLQTVLAHEYTHAVVFCEHVFGTHHPGVPRQDEESWLNEGLAHLVESLHGYGGSNLDHRVRAFLAAPERYPLVVPDYFHAGLWRTAGTRGGTFLFARWCHDRFGSDLLGKLVRSNLSGTGNLEAATGEPFAELFRRWTVGLVQGEVRTGLPSEPVVALPICHEVRPSAGTQEFALAGSAALYLHLPPAGSAGMQVTITGQADQPLQVTLVSVASGRQPQPKAAEPAAAARILRE